MSFLWFVLKFFISKSSIVIFIYLKLFIKVSTMTRQNNLSEKKKDLANIYHIFLYIVNLRGHHLSQFSPQLHGQHQMQFSQSMGHQQFQGRQLPSGHVQHGIGQSQLNQGNQMNRHLSQFSSTANSALFNAAQATSNAQMVRYTSPLIHFLFFFPFHAL